MATKSDDINQKVEKKTSFSAYVLKDLRLQAMLLGGVALGAGLGLLASRSSTLVNGTRSAAKWVATWFKPETAAVIIEHAEQMPAGVAFGIVGGVAGMTAGAVPNTYEHWKEGKKQQLRVEEMADDIVSLREQRNAAMGALREQATAISAQNSAIKNILEQGPRTHETIAANSPPEEQAARLEQQRAQQSSEPQRG